MESSASGDELSVDDIYAKIDQDGKVNTPASTAEFLTTAVVGVPLWLFGILPLTLVTQVCKSILQNFTPTKNDENNNLLSTDTPKVNLDDITPRENRKYDIVVLGATGFTGKLCVDYMVKTYGVGNSKVSWAIAGRSSSKLDMVKSDIAKELGQDDVLKLDTLIVDTSDRSTLIPLVQNTRCVVTTAGPFQKYGSNVVEFCARYGTHYVDTTGEVEWHKLMILKWDAISQQSGSKIISFCGHDCIPWDLTVQKLSQRLREECQNSDSNEELVSVTCFNEILGGVSGGTIETSLTVLGVKGNAMAQPKHDFNPLLKLASGDKSPNHTKGSHPSSIEKVIRPGRFASQYRIPFLMAAVNTDIVKRSNALNSKGTKSLLYSEGQVVPDFKTAFTYMFGLIVGLTALMNPITGTFLTRYVLPKPGQGPSKEAMEKGFLAITGEGVGSKGTKVESIIYFPGDAGYLETARMVVESGLCLGLDEDKLPNKKGGFFTPAIGLGDLLLNRLCETGTYFASRVVSSPK